jgi:hypothetical protein
MPSKSIPESWQSFLSDIDASLSEDVELHCLGGFVVNHTNWLKEHGTDPIIWNGD